jgi:hypothetical protein
MGCQDNTTEPVDQTAATAPEFDFMNGPAFPGNSGVERFEEPWTFNYSVDMQERWLLATYDVWDGYAGCTLTYPDPELMEPWDVQQMQRETPDGVLTTWLVKGEHDVYFMDHLIYDQSVYDWDTEACPWVMASWKYKGTAKFVVQREFLDGELVRRVQSGNGFVEDREGNLFKLDYHERVGTNSDQLRIDFTPIGK